MINLAIPPLRERSEDVSILSHVFLDQLIREMKREPLEFTLETLDIMRRYSWPGNVRQLRNAIERMVVLGTTQELTADLLPPEVQAGPDESGTDLWELPYKDAVKEFRKQKLRRAIERCGGNKTHAAKMLGIQRSYLVKAADELEIG